MQLKIIDYCSAVAPRCDLFSLVILCGDAIFDLTCSLLHIHTRMFVYSCLSVSLCVSALPDRQHKIKC